MNIHLGIALALVVAGMALVASSMREDAARPGGGAPQPMEQQARSPATATVRLSVTEGAGV